MTTKASSRRPSSPIATKPTLGHSGQEKKKIEKFRERLRAKFKVGARVKTPDDEIHFVKTIVACGEKGRGEIRYYLDNAAETGAFYYGDELRSASWRRRRVPKSTHIWGQN